MDAKMATEIFNTTSAQPESPQSWAYKTSQLQGALPDFLAEWSAWQYVVTFLVGLVLFVVLASDRDLAHKVFKSPAYAEPCLVPVARDIIGHKAWVFLQGRDHAEYRRGLVPLFTSRAIATYLPVQERVLDDYYNQFVAATKANQGKPMAFMTLFREINCALSCRTFFGDYISDDQVKKIADDFYLATDALDLVNIPLAMYVPFTKTWLGKRTADAVHRVFAECAARCKANMAKGATPTCIVDHWVLHMMESNRYRERVAAGETNLEKPKNMIREFTNEEISDTLFTFLFASQDASSSATTWLFQILAQRPDVLDKLREENLAARGGDRNKPFDLPMLESLTYTNAVIKELLRYKPPVILVPYLATKDFPVTPDYTVPKGSMIIPSCYPALHDPEAYPNPDVFDPERWISGDAESKTKNWLVFGAGPHDCLARKYVPLSLAGMIGKASLELDWEHHPTPRSEEIRVFATLFPMVSTGYSKFLLYALVRNLLTVITGWMQSGFQEAALVWHLAIWTSILLSRGRGTCKNKSL
ncbi:unnamed protein product [Aspergillus oryzae]|uniref:Unnamed protein product n=1 Tax=Aspergillus oryzae TaxID=5062 RepID=A0AAN4YR08_ASPOZ|nr:unnamed protein product [Aspergillus oryzae]